MDEKKCASCPRYIEETLSAAGLHRQRAVTLCSCIAGAGGSPSFAEKL
jgi:hypothetical protein